MLLNLLKLLGASERSCFERANFRAEPWDILLNDERDLTTYTGVELLLRAILKCSDLYNLLLNMCLHVD